MNSSSLNISFRDHLISFLPFGLSEKKVRSKKSGKKHRGGRRGTAAVPKFLKVADRGWMWTYGDEERSDEDMEELFVKEKELNSRVGSSRPFCCICALTTSPFVSYTTQLCLDQRCLIHVVTCLKLNLTVRC